MHQFIKNSKKTGLCCCHEAARQGSGAASKEKNAVRQRYPFLDIVGLKMNFIKVLIISIVPTLTSLTALVIGQRGLKRQQTRGIKVLKTSPSDGTIVKTGQSLRLSCRTNSKWFFCVWRGPGGDKQCAIQESSPQSVCPNDNRIILQGGSNNCDIVLRNARAEDYGEWMCLVSDSVDLDSDRSSVSLEIGRPGDVEFQPGFANNELQITEGEKAEVNNHHFLTTSINYGCLGGRGLEDLCVLIMTWLRT